MSRATPASLDISAIALSALCMVHCLALPVLASALPLFGVWAEQEWVHIAFVVVALPLTSYSLWRSHRRQRLPATLRVLAAAGLAGLLAGALGWPSEAWETPITVAGSLMLAGAHLWHWARRHRH